MAGFIFGGNTGTTYEDLQRRRALADQLAQGMNRAPSNIGEGLSMLGSAIALRRMNKQISEQESAGRAAAAEQFNQFAQANGIDPGMAQAMDNPFMSQGQNAVMRALMEKKMAGNQREPVKGMEIGGRLVNPYTGEVMADFSQQQAADLPTDVREYEYARQQGFGGSYMDYQNAMKGQGFSVTTPDGTVVQMGGSGTAQGAFEKETGKNEAGLLNDARAAAKVGSELRQQAQVMRSANENSGYSGVGGGMVGTVFDTAEQLGINAPGTPQARALMRSGGLEAAMAKVQQTKGAISNKEMDLFEAASPGLTQTPEGNAALIEMMDRIGERAVKRVDAMERYRQEMGSLQGFEAEWNAWLEANPLIVQNQDGSIGVAQQDAGQPQNNDGWQDAGNGVRIRVKQ